ncbi:MAG: lipoprotein-releasing system ATP-binding protein, partial [Gaiellaceae bacterium]|nr:lipoprotein-releasing system ATP-binding protein [Gaiellaceae bacterium]
MTVMTGERTALSTCEKVSVVYGDGEARVDALCDFDFSVRKGETVALWGRSGSGKTTILHVLGGLVAPTSGTVSWRGDALSTLDVAARAEARREGIAYVFQGSNLLPHFTAYENVAFTGTAHAEGLLAL